MKFPEQFRRSCPRSAFVSQPGDPFGVFRVPPQKLGKTTHSRSLQVIASAGDEAIGVPWEHVSVSLKNSDLCPTWDEMCLVKSLFWEPSECVVQFHPPEADYVNTHPGCLYLWRPTDREIPTPPNFCV